MAVTVAVIAVIAFSLAWMGKRMRDAQIKTFSQTASISETYLLKDMDEKFYWADQLSMKASSPSLTRDLDAACAAWKKAEDAESRSAAFNDLDASLVPLMKALAGRTDWADLQPYFTRMGDAEKKIGDDLDAYTKSADAFNRRVGGKDPRVLPYYTISESLRQTP